MNIFIQSIKSGKISTEADLKHLFWKLAKILHPDVASVDSNHAKFIKLKSDFDEATVLLSQAQIPATLKTTSSSPNFNDCASLFSDLVASNFPIDPSIRLKNKSYMDRLKKLNSLISLFGNDYINLILNVEKELIRLRGPSVVSNHPFSLVKLYFYRLSDYFYFKTAIGFNYLFGSHDMMVNVLKSKDCEYTIKLINWFLDKLRD